jgi:hypothetical protein
MRHGPAHLKGHVPEVVDGRILGHEAVGTRVGGRGGRDRRRRGQPRAHLVHLRLRPLPLLPHRSVPSMPRRGRLGPRTPHRRHPGRIRPRPVRRPVTTPDSLAGKRQAIPTTAMGSVREPSTAASRWRLACSSLVTRRRYVHRRSAFGMSSSDRGIGQQPAAGRRESGWTPRTRSGQGERELSTGN